MSDYKKEFEDLINNGNYSFWKRLIGSQFLSGLALLFGHVMDRSKWVAERALQETRLSTAITRSSILAKAEDAGYIPRLIVSSVGKVEIFNDTAQIQRVPAMTELISNIGLIYTIKVAVDIPANGSLIVDIEQSQRVVINHTVTETKKYYEVLLSKATTEKVVKIEVLVETSSLGAVYWDEKFQFRNTTANSDAYTRIYKPTDQLGVRFGNGQRGKMVEAGDLISMEVILSDGDTELVAGTDLSFADSQHDLNGKITFRTTTVIAGGAPQESIEEIRNGAKYAVAYDHQVVWNDDYTFYIKQQVPKLNRVTVWGEAEQEQELGFKDIANMNKIFVSGYSAELDQGLVEAAIITAFSTIPLLNRELKYVQVVMSPYTVVINADITVNRSVTEVIEQLKEAMRLRFGHEADGFKDEHGAFTDPSNVKRKDLWNFVDDLGILKDFDIVITGLDGERALADYRHLDTNNSTFNIGY